ncbi:MAG TPA: ABC transporter ATP-binding protein [Acidimicrobiales bacterium]|nr:ABC transporter ATP-binding protein [Acidimicrobiales bacterium]
METTTSLSLRGIEKRFGDLVAVDNLSLDLHWGEVHALLGENGAGKSTLMNIVAGFLTPDRGEAELDGTPLTFGSPRASLASGIGMVHQHFRLVQKFSVADNLAVGSSELSALSSPRDRVEYARRLAGEYNITIDPTTPVWALSEGEKQRVEILRTLSRGARVLILDEPTAVLTPEEADRLCDNLRAMAAQGRTVVFISHKLNEVLQVADRVTVMRQGEVLATRDRAECTVESLSKTMFESRDLETAAVTRRGVADDEVALSVRGLTVRDDRGLVGLHEVDLEVRRGEIVGVAGNGQRELERAITGDVRPESGEVRIGGRPVSSVRAALRAGLAYIPEDRKGTGLVPTQSIWRNAILRNYRRRPIGHRGIVRSRSAREFATALAQRVELSTSDPEALVQQLSGGNAQKLLAGREIERERTVVVAVNPSQGLDVRAATAVRAALSEAANEGLAVLLISADLDEVLAMSDRVVVLYEGRVVGEFQGEVDRDRVGLLMGGVSA